MAEPEGEGGGGRRDEREPGHALDAAVRGAVWGLVLVVVRLRADADVGFRVVVAYCSGDEMGGAGVGVGDGFNGTAALGEEVDCFDFGLRAGDFGGFVVHLRELYRVVAGVDEELASNVACSVFFLVETWGDTAGGVDEDIGDGYHARSYDGSA